MEGEKGRSGGGRKPGKQGETEAGGRGEKGSEEGEGKTGKGGDSNKDATEGKQAKMQQDKRKKEWPHIREETNNHTNLGQVTSPQGATQHKH